MMHGFQSTDIRLEALFNFLLLMLRISIRPSRWLTGLVSLLYIGMGFVWLHLPLSYTLKGLALILHSMHFYTIWNHSLSLQGEEAIIFLQHHSLREWLLCNHRGEEYRGILQPGSLCTRYFAVLYFKCIPSQERRCVIILMDSLSATEFRQLRQLLWWGL
jgi:hypothetical protein